MLYIMAHVHSIMVPVPDCLASYLLIYSKYLESLVLYHTCPKIS